MHVLPNKSPHSDALGKAKLKRKKKKKKKNRKRKLLRIRRRQRFPLVSLEEVGKQVAPPSAVNTSSVFNSVLSSQLF